MDYLLTAYASGEEVAIHGPNGVVAVLSAKHALDLAADLADAATDAAPPAARLEVVEL